MKIVESSRVYDGRVFSVDRDLLHNDSGEEYVREVVRHSGGAGGVVLFPDGTVILVRQYRHPASDYLWEIPAGKLDGSEDPRECAAREIAEETGYRSENLDLLSEFYSTPGFCDERLWIYLAKNPVPGVQSLDDDEDLEVMRLPLTDALEMVRDGKIRDAKTIVGLLLTAERL